jgi:predicted short-subunit dehydrogenase-like oxidoreductase (DUF2520 family)
MEIVIIGTGNTASILGHKLKAAGHTIAQIYGRNTEAASELAYELDSESTNYWSVVNRNADLYIIAVSDIAIDEIIRELNFPNKTVVHTAASVSKNVLYGASDHYGVLYPLQSLLKGSDRLPEVPIIIDASDEATFKELEAVAHTISDHVTTGSDEDRLKLHLAAVFCNNFVNHLYALMEDFCRKESISFNMLKPLIKETALRIDAISPAEAQTGPAIRQDSNTLQKHLHMLEAHPHLKAIYQLFTDSIAHNAKQ